ncbi:hypothetical protein KAR91_74200 [Candidatus Pacearchaeota archaeon]|nr:hypothetical protein [Candidatus Pacearchaeota archaeon]
MRKIIKITQEDFDDGIQDLIIEAESDIGKETWEEKRRYKGSTWEVFWQLNKDKKYTPHEIYTIFILKLSEEIWTNRRFLPKPLPGQGNHPHIFS